MQPRTLWIIGGVSLGGLVLAAGKLIAASRDPWNFGPPTKNPWITSGWWEDRAYRNGVHLGIDVRVPSGTPVYAVGPGVVTRVRNAWGGSDTGMYVMIAHPGGLFSRYLHLDANRVKAGQRVRKGQRIGTSGASGKAGRHAFAAHLHFDLALDERMLSEYTKRYGTPSTGFAWKHEAPGTDIVVVAVPAEPLIPGRYRERVITRATRFRIPMHPRAVEAQAQALAGGALAAPTLSIV